jgi:hypothetical protein
MLGFANFFVFRRRWSSGYKINVSFNPTETMSALTSSSDEEGASFRFAGIVFDFDISFLLDGMSPSTETSLLT